MSMCTYENEKLVQDVWIHSKMVMYKGYVAVSHGDWEYSKTDDPLFSSWHDGCRLFDKVRRREWKLEKVKEQKVSQEQVHKYPESIQVDSRLIELVKEYDWNGGDDTGKQIVELIRQRMGLRSV